MGYCGHVGVVGGWVRDRYRPRFNGRVKVIYLQGEHTALGLGLVTDVGVLLVHAHHDLCWEEEGDRGR